MLKQLFASIFGSRTKSKTVARAETTWEGFATPEAALAALEQAYRDRDVEAAVKAKNFQFEGAAMIMRIGGISDPELARQAAEVLELSYRKHAREDGLPNLTDITTSIASMSVVDVNVTQIVERIAHADGQVIEEILHAAETNGRWGIVTISA